MKKMAKEKADLEWQVLKNGRDQAEVDAGALRTQYMKIETLV